MALDGNGRYCSLDPREGAKLAVAECCRNLATAGAEPIGATNCLNFGNPQKPEIMAQLVAAIEGMGEACRHFGTPITGGNVSLYNETLGQGIDPTPVIGIVGIIENMDVPLSGFFDAPGRKLVLLGGLLPGAAGLEARLDQRFGSSQYAKVVLRRTWGLPPALDMDYEKRVQEAARAIARERSAVSVHDLSDGGLAITVAECMFGATRIGARLDLKSELPAHYLLFHEAPSRVLLAVSGDQLERVLAVARDHDVEAPVIGETQPERLEIVLNGERLIEASAAELFEIWDSAFERMLRQG
ncbi:MAG TPA: AIR synthase related protein, partial [Sphingomicrobium sp.]|nr:AIR synthase related protein [Sphingomicrobium sp.]